MTAEENLRMHIPEKVRDSMLIKRALTHRSFLNENRHALEDNERLEFLGDSILSYIVAEWLYHQYPEKKEGSLTKIRSALVHTQQLAKFARAIDLGPALYLGKGEALAGGRERDAILCDAFEALVAAIYIGSDIDTVKAFVLPMIKAQSEIVVAEHAEEDAKSRLQEFIQGQGLPTPVYQVLSERGPDHDKKFVVSVVINEAEFSQGEGHSKQAAEKNAAGLALQKLGLKE
ncbi:MAG: ribonuclease III [Anaerolineaceae bacterium]|nr:ribonuclease III [Anaerolineaceae bacterium]